MLVADMLVALRDLKVFIVVPELMRSFSERRALKPRLNKVVLDELRL